MIRMYWVWWWQTHKPQRMRFLTVSVLALAASSATAFVPHALPGTAPAAVGRPRAAGAVEMVFGMFDKKPEADSSSGKRLNLKDISKTPAAPVKKAAPKAAVKPAPKPAAKPAAKPSSAAPSAQMVNGKLVGYFSQEQMEALQYARATVPSNAPNYWQKIAAQVPGQTAETCRGMAQQIAFNKSAGQAKSFFGGNIEVKETKDYVDPDATPMNRFKQAFGLK